MEENDRLGPGVPGNSDIEGLFERVRPEARSSSSC